MINTVTSAGWHHHRQHVAVLTQTEGLGDQRGPGLILLIKWLWWLISPSKSLFISSQLPHIWPFQKECCRLEFVAPYASLSSQEMLMLCGNEGHFIPFLSSLILWSFSPFCPSWTDSKCSHYSITGWQIYSWLVESHNFPLSTPPTTLSKLHSPYHYFFLFFSFWPSPWPFYLFIPLASAVSWAINL